MPASASAVLARALETLAQQLPAPPADTLAELAAVQDEKREAFEAGAVAWNSWNRTLYCCTSASSSTAATFDVTWETWNTAGTSGITVLTGSPQWVAWNAGWQETEDQRLERERLEAERRAAWEAHRAEREQAGARALELLRSLLTDGQWASYQEKGWFEVRGRSGRRWRVRSRGQSGNVDLMPEAGEERDATYCAHPPEGLPDADAHAAQMLALVTDDEAFLRTANRHWRRAGLEAA